MRKLSDLFRKQEDESLNAQIQEVRDAWAAMAGPSQSTWCEEVYADHVIVCWGTEHYSVPYTDDEHADPEISFDLVNASEVEQVWQPVAKQEAIAKVDDDRHMVFGWAYQAVSKDGTQVVDHSGEVIDVPDLEDAAYFFNLHFREGDEMHTDDVQAHLLESFVSTPEKRAAMGIPDGVLPDGWWTGFHIPDDAVWAKVKDGTYSMFSIGGTAERVSVDA